MEIVVRRANNDDMKDLNIMFQRLLEYKKENYDENIKEDLSINSFFDKRIDDLDDIILVAMIENNVVGYIYGIIDRTNKIKIEYEANIESIFVYSDYRNIGVGTKLINEFIETIKKENVKYVYIENLKENVRAGSLYSKLGFGLFKENRKLKVGE